MFATIIVRLDGSCHAEVALPYAIDEAGRHGARLLLVRVLPRPEPCVTARNHGGPVPFAPTWPRHELIIDERQAIAYLRDVCRRFRLGIDTLLVVAVGEPGARLLAETRHHQRPLVVMTTCPVDDLRHSLSDLTRRLLTSNAVPVLGVRQPKAAADAVLVVADQLPAHYFRHVVTGDVEPTLARPALLNAGAAVGI
jgi:nucleotide-binding universal stress UspA family protein